MCGKLPHVETLSNPDNYSLSLVMWWRICQFDTNRATRISVYRKQKQQQDVRLQDSVNTEVDPELEWQHTVVSTETLGGGVSGLIPPNFLPSLMVNILVMVRPTTYLARKSNDECDAASFIRRNALNFQCIFTFRFT